MRRRGIHLQPNCLRLLPNGDRRNARRPSGDRLHPRTYHSQSKSLATASMILGIISVTIGWLCVRTAPRNCRDCSGRHSAVADQENA